MKAFSRMNYRIGRAPMETKWVYTFFLVFMLVGLFTVGGYQFRQIGFQKASVAQHYRGSEESSETGLALAKPFAAMLETTHFHAFIMGIIYLTLAHLFLATDRSRRFKMIVVVSGFLATLMDLLLPWAVRYGSENFAGLLLGAWILEWFAYMTMIMVSLYDLWWNKSAAMEA